MSASSTQAEPQMNATPLIDVLLVLLVMLMLALPLATQTTRVNLPQVGPNPPQPVIHVDITYNGDIYWNGDYVPTVDALKPRLISLAALHDPPLLMVKPERRAPYEPVAQVLTLAQQSHVRKLGVSPVPD
jgi:biopolymer transport protein ExbD